jgi:hypothetical protein
MMKVKLKARSLRKVIENGGNDSQEEMMTLDALCCVGPPKRLRWMCAGGYAISLDVFLFSGVLASIPQSLVLL